MDGNKIQRESIKDGQFFVDKTVNFKDLIAADKAGKKLVFDILDIPELPPKIYGMLSKSAKMAYIQDRRIGDNAIKRMEDNKSPFVSVTEDLVINDPLVTVVQNSRFSVLNKRDGLKYLFPSVHEANRLAETGEYKFVKPDDEESIPTAVKKGERLYITNQKGEPENVAMVVDAKKYKQHIAAVGAKSRKLLGDHHEETKQKMSQYASKVHIYDKTTLTKK